VGCIVARVKRRPTLLLIALGLGALFLIGSPSLAAADDVEDARRLFEQALDALQAGRAAEGRDLLRRSLAAHPTLAARVNLGIALRRTGEAPEAVEIFESILEGDLSAEDRELVEAQLAQAREEVATLRVSVEGPPGADVEVDGRPVGSASDEPLVVPVGAGTHVVVARAEGWRDARETLGVEPGGSRDVTVALVRSTESGGDGAQPLAVDEASDSGVPLWVWIVGGVILAGVAAAITAAIVVSGQQNDDGAVGTFYTLR
jgi:hypothetical protein